ncbi:MAG: dephospho-CoA kinase [Prochloraceae cyanobacterium]|nr:dephospho-CoA kinase [Prochloraceae cyanobacterium]
MVKPKRIVGLTGGIGTGKTTVSQYLADRYQLPILDADLYARDAVAEGSPILEAIKNRYGDRILLEDRNLDRATLGAIIFSDRTEKLWLESKIHPYVGDRISLELQKIESETVVLVVPLLFEAKMTNLVTEIWVVYCSLNQQIERIMKRNSLTKEGAIARIENQLPLEDKVAAADFSLDNSTTIEALYEQVDRIINQEDI